MESKKIRVHVGDDGILKLNLPVGVTDEDLEVIVVYSVRPKMTQEEWGKFIDETYGSLADDPIERGDQGVFEVRDEIL